MTRKALLTKPVHRWFAFPHSFASELVDALIDEWQLTSDDQLLDPFVGAGTTVLAAKERNVAATGYDISPLSELVSRVKVGDYESSTLESLMETLTKLLNTHNSEKLNSDQTSGLLVKALPGRLLTNFLHYANVIDSLTCSQDERDFFKLALISIIPHFSRAKATGGWLKWTKNNNRENILPSMFRNQVTTMISDISEVDFQPHSCWRIAVADARSIPDDDCTYTALITSPPYPNRHDYTRIFGVELMFGFLTPEQTRQLRYQSLHSHPEARPNRPDCSEYSHSTKLSAILSDLENEVSDLRVRRMVGGYFRDIYLCLREASRVCKPHAKLAFVLGNVQYAGHTIPVDELTAELGARVGLHCKKICVGRFRGNSAQQMRKYGRRPSRESIVIFERS